MFGFMRQDVMILSANLNWVANTIPELPKVQAKLCFEKGKLLVHFEVREPFACYRAEVLKDGGPCYQDSCVELFFKSATGYRNFEWNSRGFCLSAIGKDRFERKELSKEEYALIDRQTKISFSENHVFWTLEAQIPQKFLIEIGETLCGNLYKCADKSAHPHYLSLFPVDTLKPDFHRPEYFKDF